MKYKIFSKKYKVPALIQNMPLSMYARYFLYCQQKPLLYDRKNLRSYYVMLVMNAYLIKLLEIYIEKGDVV